MPSAVPGEHIYTANKLQREAAVILGVELGPHAGKDQPDFMGPGYVGEMKATLDTGVRAVFVEQFERYDAMLRCMQRNTTFEASDTYPMLFYAIVKYSKRHADPENGKGKLSEKGNPQRTIEDWAKRPVMKGQIDSIYIIDGEVMREFFETRPRQRTMWNLKGLDQVRRKSVQDKKQTLLIARDREELAGGILGPEWIGLPKTEIDAACPYMWRTPGGIPIYYSGAKGVTVTSEETGYMEEAELVVRALPEERLKLEAHMESQILGGADVTLFHAK